MECLPSCLSHFPSIFFQEINTFFFFWPYWKWLYLFLVFIFRILAQENGSGKLASLYINIRLHILLLLPLIKKKMLMQCESLKERSSIPINWPSVCHGNGLVDLVLVFGVLKNTRKKGQNMLIYHLSLGMAMGRGGTGPKDEVFVPAPHGFILPHPLPAPHDKENFLTSSPPLEASQSPTPSRKTLLFINLPYN